MSKQSEIGESKFIEKLVNELNIGKEVVAGRGLGGLTKTGQIEKDYTVVGGKALGGGLPMLKAIAPAVEDKQRL